MTGRTFAIRRRAFWLAALVVAAVCAGLAVPAQAAPVPAPSPSDGARLQRPISGSPRTIAPRTVSPGGTWAWQNPKPNGNPLLSISCPSTTTCFAAGFSGEVLKTTDGGTTWSQLATHTGSNLNGISCPSATNCVAVGDNGVVVTTGSGGTIWTPPLTINGGNFLVGVSCPSVTVCFADGAAGSILVSSDGGATWVGQSSGTINDLLALTCPTTAACMAAGVGGTITATTNGGTTWTVQTSGPKTFYGITCTNATTCAAVGQDGVSPVTTNGGSSWSNFLISGPVLTLVGVNCPVIGRCFATGVNGSVYVEAPCMSYATNIQGCWERSSTDEHGVLYSISCPTTTACFASGDYGMVVSTINGGTGWQKQSPNRFAQLNAISCASTIFCVGVSLAGEALVSDGLTWWSVRPLPTAAMLWGVSCPSSNVCFGVGSNGTIVATSNGGLSWTAQTANTTAGFTAISCPTVSACFAVATGGVIDATTDGGSHWNLQTSGTTSDLLGISCPTLSVCYAAGRVGSSLGTSNGGVTWSTQGTMSDSPNAISCPSSTTCFAVGFKVEVTTNSGATWSAQPAPLINGQPYYAISCASTTVCTTVTGGGVVATTDGSTWSTQSAPTVGGYLYGISCPTTSTCVAAGTSGPAGGVIIGTTDGGATSWHLLAPSGTTADLQAVSCPSPVICFAAAGADILRTTSAGIGWFSVFHAKYSNFWAMSCPSISVCFATTSLWQAPDSPIFRTTDGGITWTAETVAGPGPYAVQGYVSVSCPSTSSCVAVGNGKYVHTSDGSTWSAPASIDGVASVTGISCPISTTCFATDGATPGHVYRSTDSGVSWTLSFDLATDTQAGGSGPFTAIDCPSVSICYATGWSGLIATTTDGGANWRTDFTGSQAVLTGISCPNLSTCDVSANDSTILRTTNYGGRWEIEFGGAATGYSGISCPDFSDCFAVGLAGSITATTNGGAAWARPQPTGVTENIHGLSCVGASNCYAAAGETLMSSHDGGATWTALALGTVDGIVPSLTPDVVVAISCPAFNTCFAVGWPGAIYRTGDGGATWTYETSALSGSDHTLTGISCASINNCVAVGESGLVLSTINGSVWGAETSGTTHNLWGVSCPSTYSCIAVGDSGLTLTRSDGTWAIDPSGTGVYLLAANCPSINVCYATGYGGTMLTTSNRGASWASLKSGTNYDLDAISCLNNTMCLAAGSVGTASMTINGSTWTTVPMPNSTHLRAAAFVDLAHAWIVGNGGTILANSTLVPSCSSATLTSDKTSPQPGGALVTFTSHAAGSACTSPLYEYWMWTAATGWVLKQAYSGNPEFVLDTTGMAPGTYTVDVWAEQSGSLLGTSNYETFGLEAWVVGGCDSATLTPNPAPTTGTVMFTATAAGSGCNSPEYQFWMWSPATGWVVKQAYSSTSTLSVNVDALAPATYSVDVWVRQTGSPIAYETWALSSIPKGACGPTTVSATQTSPQPVGTPINLTAVNTGCTVPNYRYWEYPSQAGGGPNAIWTMLRDYSPVGTYLLDTTNYKPGTQSIVVHVRAATSTAAYDTDGLLAFSLSGCSNVGLTASPGSPQPPGTTVTLTASAAGCSTPLYQFWYYLPGTGWVMVQNYSPTATYNWNTGGLPPGTYAWVVFVKQQGSANDYDTYALFSDTTG